MTPLDPIRVPLSGRHVVEASAGTGKTFTITTLVVRLVVERCVPIEKILVVTFTRAATAELRDRVRRRLREAVAALGGEPADDVLVALVARWAELGIAPADALGRLQAALESFDLAPITTIHGFCQRVLRDHAFVSGVPFGLELAEDTGPWLAEVAQDLWTSALHDADKDLVAWMQRALAWPEVLKIVGEATRAAGPRFLPDDVAPGPMLLDAGPLREAYEAARVAWKREGEALCTALIAHPRLHNGTYGARGVEPRRDRLDLAFDLPDLPLDVADLAALLGFFSREAMEGKLTGGAGPETLPDLAVIDALATLAEAWEAWLGPEGRFVEARVRLCRTLAAQARPRLLAARGRQDDVRFFDDLITDLRDALRRPGSGPALAATLREAYPVALIDEFQDTDAVQYAVFASIYDGPDATAYLIGDPKQAIYAFRGADVYAYLDARDEVQREAQARGESRVWDLATNFRSDRALVEAVGLLFSRPRRPFGEARIPFVPVGARHPGPRLRIGGAAPAPLRFRFHPGKGRGGPRVGELPDAVADDVAALLSAPTSLPEEGGRPLGPGDVAVLVSSHWEASQTYDALQARGVPCVRYGNVRVFGTEEAGEVAALIEALLHPGDPRRVRAALVTPLFGRTAADLVALDADEARLQVELTRLRRWRETWDARGFARMFQELLRHRDDAGRDATTRLLAAPGGERRLTNLRHLAELLHGAEQDGDLRPVGVAAWLAAQRGGRADDQGPAEVRLESDGAAVRIVTMHVSKGLEYPVVFCPSVWRPARTDAFPRFHDGDDALCLQLQPEAHPAHVEAAAREGRAERLRLAYVALTRARHLCVVSVGRFSGGPGRPGHEEGPLAHLLFPADHDDEAAPVGANAERLRRLDDDALRARLEELAEASSGGIEVVDVDAGADPVCYRPPRPPVAVRSAEACPRAFGLDVRMSSFSGLVRARHEAEHDRDAGLPQAPPVSTSGEGLPLDPLPRGARAGTAYHAVMEHLDFARPGAEEAVAVVRRELRRHGLDEGLAPAVLASVSDVCATPLGDGAPALGGVARGERLDELEFLLPAGGAVPLTPERLAAAFRGHGDPVAEQAAGRIARLGFAALHGALSGFVDLVFRHEGRWYVVDYKTNHLGPRLDDYQPAAVQAAMVEHDYVLQATLYLVALHRHLRRRSPGHAYDAHVGGIRYLFVRGMTPHTGASRGVFSWRPPEALVDAVDRVLGGAA
ncbi:MAG: exodeoxyribonuclease V subunit beta [Alphaproteobacteria bacterium]|nr:exodeoxyribonuclease V subunit beta [Alphaproteobacteria bacterium]